MKFKHPGFNQDFQFCYASKMAYYRFDQLRGFENLYALLEIY